MEKVTESIVVPAILVENQSWRSESSPAAGESICSGSAIISLMSTGVAVITVVGVTVWSRWVLISNTL